MGPKSKRSKSPDSQFLFVNEDASTVTRTTKDVELDRTKQSHVQRQNFARRRRLQRESGTAAGAGQAEGSSSASETVAVPATATSSPSPTGEGHDYFDALQGLDLGDSLLNTTINPALFESFQDVGPSTAFLNSISSVPFTQSVSALGHQVSHVYQPGHFFDSPPPTYAVTSAPNPTSHSIHAPLTMGLALNPLAIHPRVLEQWAPPLIQHYNTVILPEKFWADTQKVPMNRMRHAFAIHADMQACMTDPAHMYAFLINAASQMYAREGRYLIADVSPDDAQRVLVFFKTKAVQALRSRLASGQVDHRLATDIHQLYSAGVHADTYEVAEQHFRALLTVVQALGGFDTFDDYQLEKMIMVDCYAGMSRLSVPSLAASLDPGPLSPAALHRIRAHARDNPRAGLSFPATVRTHDILGPIVDDLTEIVNMASYLRSVPEYLHDQYRWLNLRQLTLVHRLLSVSLRAELTDQQESARIALIYWVELLRSPPRALRGAAKSNHLLRERLRETVDGALWSPCTDFLLWIAVVGGITAPVGGDDRGWYEALARNAACALGVHDLPALEHTLAGFFYDPGVQKQLVARFASEIWS